MKIPDNYIKELVQDIASENGVKLVFLIKDRENVSEFKIAEKLNLTVNEVRNILYRLQDKNLVFFTRKKDKKKGWYIYYWTFDMPKARDLMLATKQGQREELLRILREETQGNVYVCPNKCIRSTAEQALEHQFRCPECEAVMVEENVEKRMEKTRKEVEKMSREIEEISKIQKPLPPPEPEKKPARKPKQKIIKRKPMKKPARQKSRKRQPLKKSKKPVIHHARQHASSTPLKPRKMGFLRRLRLRRRR